MVKSNINGYIALISVFIISALAIFIASSANLLSISESDMSLEESQGGTAFYYATACIENALMKLKENLNYSGNETLNFEDGNCVIFPIEGLGNDDRTVKVSGTCHNQTRKIEVKVERVNPEMKIKSWQEVVNF